CSKDDREVSADDVLLEFVLVLPEQIAVHPSVRDDSVYIRPFCEREQGVLIGRGNNDLLTAGIKIDVYYRPA
ncbi:MAG TPA: hypothetical protein VFJ06_11255, partial [Halococcus sp.]|nr:hypothetical protein [Halococcus sp.]